MMMTQSRLETTYANGYNRDAQQKTLYPVLLMKMYMNTLQTKKKKPKKKKGLLGFLKK